jgi:pyruvate/2-oxoacid:ferredoxin oxidoreductase beta subunit
LGAIDYPVNPLSLAIASEATFVARSIDIDVKHLGGIVEAAARHKGFLLSRSIRTATFSTTTLSSSLQNAASGRIAFFTWNTVSP